jgi:hypothetical protein
MSRWRVSGRKCRSSRYGAGWFATWRGSVFSVAGPQRLCRFRFNTAPSDLCSPAGIVLPGFVSTASAAESFSDLSLARYARVCVIASWYVMTYCNTRLVVGHLYLGACDRGGVLPDRGCIFRSGSFMAPRSLQFCISQPAQKTFLGGVLLSELPQCGLECSRPALPDREIPLSPDADGP